VQVYAGANGLFTLVEDDGATTAYESGEQKGRGRRGRRRRREESGGSNCFILGAVRTTDFKWLDSQSTLVKHNKSKSKNTNFAGLVCVWPECSCGQQLREFVRDLVQRQGRAEVCYRHNRQLRLRLLLKGAGKGDLCCVW